MKYVKKILVVLLLVFGVAFAGVYAFWALIFFPDDYETTREEALLRSETRGSQVMTHSLATMIDRAVPEGDFSHKHVNGIVRQMKKKSFLIKEDAYIRSGKRYLVYRFGTGTPGIWVDERSSILLPAKNTLTYSIALKKKSVLEFSAISPGGKGTLSVEVLLKGRAVLKKTFSLPAYTETLGENDVAMRLNNRGYERARDDLRWKDFSADLTPWSGHDVSIRFSYDSDTGTAFIGNPQIFAQAEVRRPNVIYIVFDGVATRHWSMYNEDSSLTPYMAQTAEQEFFVFNNMFTLGDKTRISTVGLFCSVLPFVTHHGINRNFIPESDIELFYDGVRNGRFAALPDVFRRAGYVTEQFGNSGFTVQLISTGVDYGFERSFEFSYNPYDSYGISHRFFKFLRDNREREFFAYCHYNTPHKPFFAPAQHYLKGIVNSPLGSLWRPDFMGCISYNDDVFKNIHTALKTNGLLENTVIVYATDHGAGFDLSHFDAGFQYADYTRMTFMMRVPRNLAERRGIGTRGRVNTFLSSINTAPTLAALTGIGPVPQFTGKSFIPILKENSSESFFGKEIWTFGRKQLSLITKDLKKYILTNADAKRYVNREHVVWGVEREVPFEMIFDLKKDPWETRNILNQHHDLLTKFRKRILDADIHHPERTVLAIVPDDTDIHGIEISVKGPAKIVRAELYTADMKEAPGLSAKGPGVFSFPVKGTPRYFVLENSDDRAALEILIKDNGKAVPGNRMFGTYLYLNNFTNPLTLRKTEDFLVLNQTELPDVKVLKEKKTNGLRVGISRIDLHRWIDIGGLEQKNITAGMKQTLKSWGYIQ
ncbi:MAG TPA: sulfatase-like hydrolase/transferase [Spirochaetota bacterium]|nr:sulfatase-like hydrolase/transferase [Spirochaetota bacterium]